MLVTLKLCIASQDKVFWDDQNLNATTQVEVNRYGSIARGLRDSISDTENKVNGNDESIESVMIVHCL